MSELIEVELPDGQVVWVRVAEDGGPRDVGVWDRVHKLKGFTEALSGVAHNVRGGLAAIAPDETTVAFGLELAVGKDGLVAALAGVNGKATLTVTLSWKGDSRKEKG